MQSMAEQQLEVGQVVTKSLRSAGLKVEWNEDPEASVLIKVQHFRIAPLLTHTSQCHGKAINVQAGHLTRLRTIAMFWCASDMITHQIICSS